jgi:predicted membrane channel-forming protein YqfA (hemolysin III family)
LIDGRRKTVRYWLIFVLIILSSYVVPYYVLKPEPASLKYFAFWTAAALFSIILAFVIMSRWREEE